MKKPTRFQVLISVIAMVGLVNIPLAALAMGPVNITEVATDFDADTLTITGENFSFGNTLEVTLGEFGLLNIVGVPTDTEIVLELPVGILPGDYLLTVSTGTGQTKNDEYDLTVGGATGAGYCPCFDLASAVQIIQAYTAPSTIAGGGVVGRGSAFDAPDTNFPPDSTDIFIGVFPGTSDYGLLRINGHLQPPLPGEFAQCSMKDDHLVLGGGSEVSSSLIPVHTEAACRDILMVAAQQTSCPNDLVFPE